MPNIKYDSILSFLGRRAHSVLFFMVILITAASLWLNITRQSTPYGTGGGQYADQIDSYSEYIIRNSVIHRLTQSNGLLNNLIYTEGYRKADYSYSPYNIINYHSNRGIQFFIYTGIARYLNLDFHDIRIQESFFQYMRLLNCLLLSGILGVFFRAFIGANILALSLTFLFASSSGFALFSSNLYFQTWAMILPLACYPLLLRNHWFIYGVSAFFASCIYFSIRYEFATTFALLWLFPPILAWQRAGLSLKSACISGGLAFSLCCFGFILALAAHHFYLAQENGISLREASELILSSLEKRVASLDGVPGPFSIKFLLKLCARWDDYALSFPLFMGIRKFFVLIVFMAVTFYSNRYRTILVWAALCYMSWYVFAYQHIMEHRPYDTLLFTVSIQLSLICILGMWLADKIKGIPHKWTL